MKNNSKISSPMSGVKGLGKTAPGTFDRLAIPTGHPALNQPATPSRISFRTGEVKPGGHGGSSKINSPMVDKPKGINKRIP